MESPADLAITQIRHTLLVADLGSFHAAAEKAFRSQPAISKSIQALESRLGAELFEPSRRTVLTPFGSACLPHLRELLAHHDRTWATVSALIRKDEGSLTVAAIAAAAGNWLPAVIRDFSRDFPGVQLRLIDDNSQNVERLVLNHEVDFGVASQIGASDELVFEPLVEDIFGVVCGRTHPLAGAGSLRWSDLASLPLIGTTAHRQLEGTPEHAWLEKPFIQVSTMLTLLSLLREGPGVTVLGRYAVPAIAASELAFVPLAGPRRTRALGIVRRADQSPSPAAHEMLLRLRAKALTLAPEAPEAEISRR